MRAVNLSLVLCLLVLGCDPIQSKLDFKNNTNKTIYARTFFFDADSTIKNNVLLIKINPKKKRNTESLYDSKTIFKNHNDSLLNVVIFNNYSYLIEEYESYFKTDKSDSLLMVGDYMIRSYSYSELEKKGWLITYPDDSFKKGKPLIIGNKHKEFTPKPNPKILKEKGIEDRWNKRDSL